MSAPKPTDRELVPAARLNGMVAIFQHAAKRDAAVLEAAELAMQFLDVDEAMVFARSNPTPEQLAERGFATKQQLHVAIHALKAKKDMPGYLSFAHERRIAGMRIATPEGDGDGAHAFVIPTTEAPRPEAEGEGDDDP